MNSLIKQQLSDVRTRIKDLTAQIATKSKQLAEAQELEKVLAAQEEKSAPAAAAAPAEPPTDRAADPAPAKKR